MNILYQCSNEYAPYAGVSITSLFENNQEMDEINVYIAGSNIDGGNVKKFQTLAQRYNRKIQLLDMAPINQYLKESRVKKFHGGYATYFKLFLTRYLPESLSNILYIDSDCIIVSSLAELERMNLKDEKFILAMVCAGDRVKERSKIIGMEAGSNYFNAGVILFDLDAWRTSGCEEALLNLIKNDKFAYVTSEQDLLNNKFSRYTKVLDPKYNVIAGWVNYGIKNYMKIHEIDSSSFYPVHTVEAAIKNPSIIHGVGDFYGRTWNKGNSNPFNDEWRKYKNISLWCDIEDKPLRRTWTQKIQAVLFTVLPRPLYVTVHHAVMKMDEQKLQKKS